MTVEANEILRGAYYSMEQAGSLLNDAYVLYRERRWATSLILAVFSIEEMGKAELLLARAIKASSEGPMDVARVREGLGNHIKKLQAGRGPATVPAPVVFHGDPEQLTREEVAELGRRLAVAKRIAVRDAPGESHDARMHSLYVDLGQYGWLRPADTTQDEAYLQLSAAASEYEIRKRRFVEPTEAFVREAIARMSASLPPLSDAPDIEWPQDLPPAES